MNNKVTLVNDRQTDTAVTNIVYARYFCTSTGSIEK